MAWTCGVQRAELLCDLQEMSFQARTRPTLITAGSPCLPRGTPSLRCEGVAVSQAVRSI